MPDSAVTLDAVPRAQAALGRIARTGFSLGRMFAVTRKELRSYFAFPLVYLITGIFLLITGYYAYTDLNFFVTMSFGEDMLANYWQLLFVDIAMRGLLLTLPFITMRLFAEERKLGTVELLYTYPLRDGEILGGKYLASLLVFLMMLALTVACPWYLHAIRSFPLTPLVAGYLGLVLLGAAFIACGIFVSSLCESQVVAGIGTIVLLLFFWILNWNEAALRAGAVEAIRMFSIFDQFSNFAKGVIDLDHVTYFIFFISFFLYLTLLSMGARKWTGRR